MASLKGKGAMTGVNLIARVFHNAKTKDGKTQYADVQVDARDPRGPTQSMLHLKSEWKKDSTGQTVVDTNAPYSQAQIDAIAKAAGPNTEPILNKDGGAVGTLYGFKGNVMPAAGGTGLVVNTKSVEPSEFKVDGTTLNTQYDSMRKARARREQARTSVVGPVAAAEPTAGVAEPAVG